MITELLLIGFPFSPVTVLQTFLELHLNSTGILVWIIFNWLTSTVPTWRPCRLLIWLRLPCIRGTRWHSWLRHCATRRKAAGSSPDHSDRSMGMGSTQPLTEMSKGGRFVGLTTLPPSCGDCLEILGASTSWPVQGQVIATIYPSRNNRIFPTYR
jgi:hypothetical protein